MLFEIFFNIFPQKLGHSNVLFIRGLIGERKLAVGALRQKVRYDSYKGSEYTQQFNNYFQTNLHIVHK